MGQGYGVICSECGQRFEVHEGSGMMAMPFHCVRCGKEWWWEFGPGGPKGKAPDPPTCECGGTFKVDAPARCPKCRSAKLKRDPEGPCIDYD
jgi:DNA-directed RNA polymerase subunit RPC12/RpoP